MSDQSEQTVKDIMRQLWASVEEARNWTCDCNEDHHKPSCIWETTPQGQ